MTFKPVSRHCLYCKDLIHIIEPVDQVKCHSCGEVMKVVQAKTVKLSKITSGGK
ncbi:hypothetical protein [Methanolobus sp.]|uniref:hypothetical protein n=1 Tax=Methanolobus sp. TaxID=1874737 RepID=UPI0025E008C5|nr:hypothetical protein [Methanolobus sp.]